MKTFILDTIKKGAANPYAKVTFKALQDEDAKPWLNKPYSNIGYVGKPLLNRALELLREKCDSRATITDALATRHIYTAVAVFYVQPPRIDSHYNYDEMMSWAANLVDDPKMLEELPEVTNKHFCNMLTLGEEMDTLGLNTVSVIPTLLSGKADLELIIEVMTKLSPIGLKVLSTHILYLTGDDIFQRSSLDAVVGIIGDGVNDQEVYPVGSVAEQHVTRNPYGHPMPQGGSMSILGASVSEGRVVLDCLLVTNDPDVSKVVDSMIGNSRIWECSWQRHEVMGVGNYRIGLISKVSPQPVGADVYALEGPAFNGGKPVYLRSDSGSLVYMPPNEAPMPPNY